MVVLPSISEGLSRSLLEAMACEKPVIATGIPANLSLVQDGVNGLIVPLGRAELLAEAILRLAKDKNLQRRLGRAARKTILREYGVDKRVERMLDAYSVAVELFQQSKMTDSLRGGFSPG
jgi:glycosyltransferase involved in cell wall biosynthesis